MKHNLYEYNVKYKLFVVCVFKLVWCVTKKKKNIKMYQRLLVKANP